MGIGVAHSKLILIGEHSVVYGKPAIALPFPLVGVESTVESTSQSLTIDCSFYNGPVSTVPRALHGLAACISETLERIGNTTEELLIRISSTIPQGRGLGSSAAVAIAVVRSIFAYHRHELSQKELMSLAHIAESYAHGNPSGIDTATASTECPLLYVKGQPLKSLSAGAPLHLIVADSGRAGDTRAAVNSVSERLRSEPIVIQRCLDRLGELTHVAKEVLATGDFKLLGQLLNYAHTELINLGVSDSGLNHLVNIARQAGAYGAKLTGGGRGGCILALARDSQHKDVISKALLKAGAKTTWSFTLENEYKATGTFFS
jgi:mevalonate kinase